jgi:hypothetical protein
MNGETLDPVAEQFYQSAWLSALTGFCSNPKNTALSPGELAERSEKVAHKAADLFRKIHLDVDPDTLTGAPLLPPHHPDKSVPSKVQKAAKKKRA